MTRTKPKYAFCCSPPSLSPSPLRGAGHSHSALSQIKCKVPWLGVVFVGTLAAGSLFFGTVKNAVADPGDAVTLVRPFDYAESRTPLGAAYDNLEK
jgi:hypothetical protein